jgi:hypothetical protein
MFSVSSKFASRWYRCFGLIEQVDSSYCYSLSHCRPSQFVLFGCSPEACLEYSKFAIEFYVAQSNLSQQERSEAENNILRRMLSNISHTYN